MEKLDSYLQQYCQEKVNSKDPVWQNKKVIISGYKVILISMSEK